MPLDGTDLFENRALAKLNQMERLLATEQHWCKGRLRDANGRRCMIEAITAVDGRQELMRPIIRAAREVSGKRYWRIESFNDDPRTTHRDVLRVLQRARESIVDSIAASRAPQPWRQKLVEALRMFGPGDQPAANQALCPAKVEDRYSARASHAVGYGRHPRSGSRAIRETSDASW
ncbi:MAG TPA: hypothetical protein VGM07_08075 [Stellaceae bacterium]|jgi:hypothetical protein